jgi:phosphatidylinositol-4,5-bisphosphate 3-kinase catalytic subunit alpha/beta/delta
LLTNASVPSDLYRTFDVSIDPGQSIASLKLFLWVEVFQTQNVSAGGHLTDYLFRAGEDDYFLDEKILVRDTPFFNFCGERKFCPTVYFVQRNELEKLNKAIEVVMEAPLLMNEEAGQFRKEMHRILSAVMFKHYRRLPFLNSFEPTATESASGVWPQAFPVQIFVPEDNNPNSARPPEKRTVAIPFRGAARRVISSAQSDYPYLFEFKSEEPNDYVVKIRGYNEFFVGNMELIASEYVRDSIRKRKRIDLVIIEKDHLPLESLGLVSHYSELLAQGKKQSALVDMETLLSRESHPPNLRFSSLSLDRPLKVLLKSLEPISFDPKLFNAPKKRTDLIQLFASCEVRHVGAAIGVVMRSNKQFYYEDAKDPVKFDSMFDMPSYAVLPRASVLHFEIHALYRDKDTLIGWTEYQLFDSRGVITPGTFSSGLWLLAGEAQAAQQPVSGSSLLEKSTGPKLTFVIEDLGKPVVFPEFDYSEWQAENPNPPADEPPSVPVVSKLKEIVFKDALQVLEKDEKALLWQHRGWCKTQPAAAAKLLLSVPWVRPGAARDLYRLLHEWAPLSPMAAIELLNKNFIDPEIRAFAVRNLHRLSDDELADILLQLVQALKHELDHDSFLARFLIIRAIYNPFKLGNYFFWYLKASLLQTAYRERFEVVLEVYLRYCGSFRQNLGAQLLLFRKIHAAAIELKTLKEPRRKPFLDDKLEHLGVETPFQIPISCTYVPSIASIIIVKMSL